MSRKMKLYLFVLLGTPLAYLASLYLDFSREREVFQTFGCSMGAEPWVVWRDRLDAWKSLQADALEFKRWCDAGCPEDDIVFELNHGMLDVNEEADTWVYDWLDRQQKKEAAPFSGLPK